MKISDNLKYRMDSRNRDEFQDNVEKSNIEEEKAIRTLVEAHNSLEIETKIITEEASQRTGIIENLKDDKGDYNLIFTGKQNFDIVVEVKCRNGFGPIFRPKESDVIRCIKKNRPYLLFHNHNQKNEQLLLLDQQDLIYIRDNIKIMTQEQKEDGKILIPYGKKPYHRVHIGDYKHKSIDFSDLLKGLKNNSNKQKYFAMLNKLANWN